MDIGRKGAQAADQAQEAEEKPSDTHLALDSLTFEDLYRVHEYTSFDTSFPMHMDHSDIKDMQESPFVETT